MSLDKFNKFFYNNRYILFIGAIFIIIGYFQVSYGLVTGTWNYFFHKEPQPLTEPVYIIKTRIENQPINSSEHYYSSKFNAENKGYQVRYWVYDVCGDISFTEILVPFDSPLINSYNKDFVGVGQENLTYSISIFTKKKEGKVILRVYSYDTKFLITKEDYVKQILQSKEVVGLQSEMWETDLSLYSRDYETLLELIPYKDKEIKVDCIGIENCGVSEIKYIISDFKWYVEGGKIQIERNDTLGKVHKLDVLLPKPNPDKITIYQFDESINQFINITLENSTNATNIIFFTDVPCNKEGKVYIHPLGT